MFIFRSISQQRRESLKVNDNQFIKSSLTSFEETIKFGKWVSDNKLSVSIRAWLLVALLCFYINKPLLA